MLLNEYVSLRCGAGHGGRDSAERFIEFQIPANQVVFIGRTAPDFGHAGGGTQLFLEEGVLDSVLPGFDSSPPFARVETSPGGPGS